MENSDDELIVAATQGDRVSQERLLLAAYDVLLGRIQQRLSPSLRDRIDPEDVMQQVMTKAFLHLGRLQQRTPAGLRAWLYRLADNEVSSQMRHLLCQKRGGGRRHMQDVWDLEGSRRLWNVLHAEESTASQQLSYAESRDSLHTHLADLPDDYRQAILLRYFQELSLAEIAQRMQRTEDAVRGVLERARRLLRQCLDSD